MNFPWIWHTTACHSQVQSKLGRSSLGKFSKLGSWLKFAAKPENSWTLGGFWLSLRMLSTTLLSARNFTATNQPNSSNHHFKTLMKASQILGKNTRARGNARNLANGKYGHSCRKCDLFAQLMKSHQWSSFHTVLKETQISYVVLVVALRSQMGG